MDRYLRDQGLTVREWLELDALDAIAASVDKGLGVAIVPGWAPPWAEGLRLRKRLLPGGYMRHTGIIWRLSGARQGAIGAFVRACSGLGRIASAGEV